MSLKDFEIDYPVGVIFQWYTCADDSMWRSQTLYSTVGNLNICIDILAMSSWFEMRSTIRCGELSNGIKQSIVLSVRPSHQPVVVLTVNVCTCCSKSRTWQTPTLTMIADEHKLQTARVVGEVIMNW